jgi:hypothetical protein
MAKTSTKGQATIYKTKERNQRLKIVWGMAIDVP